MNFTNFSQILRKRKLQFLKFAPSAAVISALADILQPLAPITIYLLIITLSLIM